jgi:dihydrofolate reductase
MGRLTVYNFVSANGYFKGPDEDISWAKQKRTKEEDEYAVENLQSGSILLFGRKTYEMMKAYWPMQQAKKDAPRLAQGMNKAEKIVFSKTLRKADWENTRIINGDIEEEAKKLKASEKDATILGSGSIVNQLAEKGLIDEFQVMVYPVAINDGTPFLKDIQKKIELKLTKVQSFKNGVVLLCYEPASKNTA